MDSAVTRLLVAIKKLLGGLNDWAGGTVTDSQISDFYVRFGNDFNAAVIAFDSIGLDMGSVAPSATRTPLMTLTMGPFTENSNGFQRTLEISWSAA